MSRFYAWKTWETAGFGAGAHALTSLKNPASGFTPRPRQISYTAFNKVSTIIDKIVF